MKLIRGVHNLSQVHYGCVLTIGNFDGVHRGHQTLLKKLREIGQIQGLPVIVMIFEPQPQEMFTEKQAPARLTRLREKLCYLMKCSVDYVICIRFNKRFASRTAKNFIDDLIVKRLRTRFLVVGEDFRFGSGRKGNFLLLKKAGLKYGFDVTNVRTLFDSRMRISSTVIRQMLLEDKLEIAEKLLGHPFTISGRVIQGDGLGRTIGFPTANLPLYRQVSPVKGVYIVEVITGFSKIPLPGIANIGTRPTVSGMLQRLEVHLLDVKTNLYGRYISVILRKKIRNEKRFSSLNDLKNQIQCDELTARDFFNLSNSKNNFR